VRWTFTVPAGAGTGRRHECGAEDLVVIGASEQAHLRLEDDPYVSDLHCAVETRDRACVLRDLGSTNGTFVNGRRVDVGEVADGDRIRVGKTTIHVSAESAGAAEADTSCVRCGGSCVQPAAGARSEYLCAACLAREASARGHATDSGLGDSCRRCGADVSSAANRDGRAAELRSVASYLCEACAALERDRQARVLGNAGAYEVLRPIGSGGFGEVWLARHRSTGRLAAVKAALKRALSKDGRAAGWFEREMAVARDLVHPHIVRWYDGGEDEMVVYFAAEYVSGGDLEHAVGASGPLPARRAVQLTIQALAALEFAHGRGIIHRDVKPSNIMLARGPAGEEIVRISDFGLAKSFRSAGSSLLTRMGEVRGTPLYMAPEQFLNFRFVGPSVDVYAAGVTLYHLLTGSVPFDTPRAPDRRPDAETVLLENRELVRMILEEDRVPLRDRRPDIHLALAAVVDIAVQRDASDRFETAAGLGAELERVLSVL
jgi:hypothetical protein